MLSHSHTQSTAEATSKLFKIRMRIMVSSFIDAPINVEENILALSRQPTQAFWVCIFYVCCIYLEHKLLSYKQWQMLLSLLLSSLIRLHKRTVRDVNQFHYMASLTHWCLQINGTNELKHKLCFTQSSNFISLNNHLWLIAASLMVFHKFGLIDRARGTAFLNNIRCN